jgi:hypothetical protein
VLVELVLRHQLLEHQYFVLAVAVVVVSWQTAER